MSNMWFVTRATSSEGRELMNGLTVRVLDMLFTIYIESTFGSITNPASPAGATGKKRRKRSRTAI